MKWKKYTIYTRVEAEDLTSLLLSELGVEGVEIEDHAAPGPAELELMYADLAPETEPDDGRAKVSFYLGEEYGEAETATLLTSIGAGLADMAARGVDIGEGRIEEGESDETDWQDRWKEYFEPFTVGGFLIKPSFREMPACAAAGDTCMIEIDPGAAFGTGTHETTRLCLGAIEEYMRPGAKVLDIGTGSGILGIAALRKGAAHVTASEIDLGTRDTIERNKALNGLDSDSFTLIYANVIGSDEAKGAVRAAAGGDADLMLSNLFAPLIRRMACPGEADSLVRPGGIWAMSGILIEQEDEVLEALRLNPAWEVLELREMGEWCLVAARRMGDIESVLARCERRLVTRAGDAHKSTYGRLLVVGGSPGMAGAAYLAGLAAYRAGVGMVMYLGPEANRVILQTLLPEAMYRSFDASEEGAVVKLEEALSWADALILGPGLSQSEEARRLLRMILADECLSLAKRMKIAVLDADALNIIADEGLALSALRERCVITPHVLEMARLIGALGGEGSVTAGDIKKDPVGYAGIARDIWGVNVVLKDSVTAVATCQGVSYLLDAGSPAMAKAGSGDVLTGFIVGTAAICGWDIDEALPLAVYLHGSAGRAAAADRGIHSILASDIAEHFPRE